MWRRSTKLSPKLKAPSSSAHSFDVFLDCFDGARLCLRDALLCSVSFEPALDELVSLDALLVDKYSFDDDLDGLTDDLVLCLDDFLDAPATLCLDPGRDLLRPAIVFTCEISLSSCFCITCSFSISVLHRLQQSSHQMSI